MTNNKYSEPPITIHTFGSFSIRQGPLVLIQQDGRSKLLWEVFFFLLSNRPMSFYPDQILNRLYPHKQYTDPNAVMRNQLYRLRRELNYDKKGASVTDNLIYSSGRYRWENKIICTIDAEQFESLINRASEVAQECPEESISHNLEALKLYKNGYLADYTDNNWVLPFRIHFHDLYLSAVLELVGLFKQRKAYQDICNICEQALAIDYFDERIHISLIEALLARGLITRARTHYNEATTTFYIEMGIKPSSAMKHLYRIIKHQSGDFDLNPNLLLDNLKTNIANSKEACFVDSEVFQHITRYELQRDKIKTKPVFAGLLSLTGPGYTKPSKDILEEAMDQLKEAIIKSMHTKDVFTRWNEAQYLILLPDLSREEANKVLEHINYNYKILSSNKAIVLDRKATDINTFTEVFVRETGDNVKARIGDLLRPEIDGVVAAKWQNYLDHISESLEVNSCLIMKVHEDAIEVFMKNLNRDNPFQVGKKEKLGQGLYCESVIGTGEELFVPDARKDKLWDANPDLKLNMISYYGVPLYWLDGRLFGTLCVLDDQRINDTAGNKALVKGFQKVIEADLDLLVERSRQGINFKHKSE